jgi:hypothetical protein
MDIRFSAYRWLLRRLRLSVMWNLVSHALPENPGRSSVRSNEGAEGRGIGKKRMTTCNELYRGSKFALTRKGADLLSVSCCMKRGKPVNAKYSITPKTGERLADTRRSVNGLQTRITKAVIKMSAVARYLKGCKMLERYEGKLSRTVLRRGGASESKLSYCDDDTATKNNSM